jgi:dCTP deaminase
VILTGPEISRRVLEEQITIDPFDEARLNPNSYDLSLGNEVLRYKEGVLDPAKECESELIELGEEGYVMEAGDFLLGHSQEVIGSESFVPVVKGRSSAARLGLFAHVTADIFDIGSFGQTTLQLFAARRLRLVPGAMIAQVTFWRPEGEIKLYDGKYQGSRGPQPSLMHTDPFFRKVPAP